MTAAAPALARSRGNKGEVQAKDASGGKKTDGRKITAGQVVDAVSEAVMS